MTSSAKTDKDAKDRQEKHQSILYALLRDDDNKYCVDCDAKGMRKSCWEPPNESLFLDFLMFFNEKMPIKIANENCTCLHPLIHLSIPPPPPPFQIPRNKPAIDRSSPNCPTSIFTHFTNNNHICDQCL